MHMAFTNLCLASVLHLCCRTGMSYLACICMYSFHWSGKENKPVTNNKRTVSSQSGKSGKSVTSGKSGKSSKPPPPQLPYIMANEFNNVPKWVNMKIAFSRAEADNCLVCPKHNIHYLDLPVLYFNSISQPVPVQPGRLLTCSKNDSNLGRAKYGTASQYKCLCILSAGRSATF